MIYLDNAATTFPKPESVYSEMDRVNRTCCVNAGRGSYKLAREASSIISETKQLLRQLVHADVDVPVVLSPSVTIAMNQIINGYSWREGATIYVSPYEHNAVARTLEKLKKTHNVNILLLPINENTLEIDLDATQYDFGKNTPDAVFCTHVSNVTGYVLPVKEIFNLAKQYNALTVLDSAQSLGLIPIDSNDIYADLIAFTGHKTLYGPFGIGGFMNPGHVILDVFLTGGTGSDSLNLEMPSGEEGRYEAASSNLTAIAGLRAAIKELDVDASLKHEQQLTRRLVDGLNKIPGVKIYGYSTEDQSVGIVSFTVDGYKSEDVGMILDEDYEIAVRTGYHCAPFIHNYLKDEKALGTVRVGIGQFTTVEDIDKLIQAIIDIIE